MLSFANVYISPRVRASLHKVVQPQQHKRFWELVARLKEGRFDIPGLNVEKLYTKTGKLFSARMSREMRLIFSMRKDADEHSLIIHELNHHDDAYDSIERNPQMPSNLSDASQMLEGLGEPKILAKLSRELEKGIETDDSNLQTLLFRVPYYLLSDPDKYLQFEKSLDRYLRLSEEQEDILSMKEKAFLVQGPAGTGKTTLALFAALNTYEENNEDAVYLFTYHEELACVCRAYKVNLLGGQEEDAESESGIKVFSYIDFCRRHLRQSLKKKDKESKWISKQESIEILQQILSQKSRWSRHFVAEELYGLIYSILKGRFMPGTEKLPAKKEDYERIFRDYGRMPEGFDETLEIFSLYQAKLEKSSSLDEADLIRHSYESLKRNALLAAAERRLWIVIDEVQDFTELEWKSILLFWENHCKQHKSAPSFPFLSGDTNQNISRSGFRWQELESYLQSILKNLHRPNALKKVALHQNYRNTVQIHNLAAFIRKFGSDTSDLGLAPEDSGKLPGLIVASDKDLLRFLKEKDKSSDSNNPVVVLVEDEKSLSYLRRELSASKSIFLLLLRNSKGMEFEDVIIHRAFSSARNANQAESFRLFDLWYMGITRARKNLLLIQTEADQIEFKSLLQEKKDEFLQLVSSEEQSAGFAAFWENRELETPNYNVIFLERKLAQDLFDEYLKEKQSVDPSDNWQITAYAEQCGQRALQLWKRCLDFSSLGKALMQMENYEEAIPYLQRAGYREEAANCLEATEQYIDAAQEYESLQMLEDAARCYEYAQEFFKAASLYEEIGNWQLAAQSYSTAGDLAKALLACEKAGMLRSAAEIYQIKGKYQNAAELYVKVDDYLNAAQMYLRIKDKLDAARCFQKGGNFEKAIELYEGLNRWSEAASAAKEAGMHAKAARLFLKAGNLPESAKSYEAANSFEKAAHLYAKLKDYENAALAYENSGGIEAAALMYEQASNWQKALELAQTSDNQLLVARCRDRLGEVELAAQIYESCAAFSEAAYCLEKANDFTRAADLHLKSQNMAAAAACLAKIDRRLDAAKLYVVSGQISSAFELVWNPKQAKMKPKDEQGFKQLLEWCVESKRLAPAGQLLEMKKDYAAAAEKFKECLMFNNAAECLEKSGRVREAAQLFKESGDMQKAANCFRQAKLWQDAGDCFEQSKNWSEAKNMYELCKNEDGIARCMNALNWL